MPKSGHHIRLDRSLIIPLKAHAASLGSTVPRQANLIIRAFLTRKNAKK
jgi:hypothetical protein